MAECLERRASLSFFDLYVKDGKLYHRCRKCEHLQDISADVCEECATKPSEPVYKWDMINPHDSDTETEED